MKLLLADSSEIFCAALKAQLEHTHEIYTCNDGVEAVQLICRDCPDFLLLDMRLPGLDGFAVLHALGNTGRKIPVIATVGELTEFEYHWLQSLKVDCILQKPCTICQTMLRICELLRHNGTSDEWNCPDADVERILLSLGFPMNRAGYVYICHAVRILAEDPGKTLTKEVYPTVAALCGGTPESVERAIRTAIRNAWMHRNEAVWMLYFPPGRDGNIPCPKNGAFLARIAGCLLKRNKKTG